MPSKSKPVLVADIRKANARKRLRKTIPAAKPVAAGPIEGKITRAARFGRNGRDSDWMDW